jgi:hypothetical protein
VHLLIPKHRRVELATALAAQRAVENVVQIKGVPQTDAAERRNGRCHRAPPAR